MVRPINRRVVESTEIPYIMLLGFQHVTILDASDRSITHETRQYSDQAHMSIRPRELVFEGPKLLLDLSLLQSGSRSSRMSDNETGASCF